MTEILITIPDGVFQSYFHKRKRYWNKRERDDFERNLLYFLLFIYLMFCDAYICPWTIIKKKKTNNNNINSSDNNDNNKNKEKIQIITTKIMIKIER